MAGLLQLISTAATPPTHHLLSSSSSSSSSWRSQAITLPQAPLFSTRYSSSPSPHQSIIIRRRRRSISSSSSSSTATSSNKSSSSKKMFKLTYLEINSWLWEVAGGLRILVDPILVGNLDFGAPWLFDAAKKILRDGAVGVDDLLGAVDLLLITQSLDDHCHVRTLKQLSVRAPHLPVVTTPNAQPIIAALPFRDVTYLEPGQSTTINQRVSILATAGPVLGPPWQRPENGYIVTAADEDEQRWAASLYYEPHCVYDRSFLQTKGLRADVVITPVVKQLLPANFTLVSGQEDAVELARLLGARYVVPMSNGDVDAKGLLTAVLSTQGTTQAFKALLAEALPHAQVLEPTPGVPLNIELDLQASAAAAAAAT